MSKHQLIYTSCRRGMYAVYDGLNIFSHDRGITDENQFGKIKKFFGYHEPTITGDVLKFFFPEYGDECVERLYPEDETDENGFKLNTVFLEHYRMNPQETVFPMQDALIDRMPHSFIYEKLEDGSYAFARVSYLGHDYIGASSRFGNFLSHIVWFDDENLPEHYPCEYFGSDMLIDRIDNALVSNPEPPSYLPEPEPEIGYTVSFDTVSDFLHEENRTEIYKNMLHALMNSCRDGKRILICDREENVIMWIAALEYAFPIKNISDINFSSYSYSPSDMKNASKICGVIPYGTDYSYEKYESDCYVFDLFQNKYPEFNNDDKFFDFVATCFDLSKESLADFHQFLTDGYFYQSYDEDICSAFALYDFMTDGISNTDENSLKSAIGFSERYASKQGKAELLQIIIRDSGFVSCSNEVFAVLTNYIFKNSISLGQDTMQAISNLVIGRILANILNPDISFDDFAACCHAAESDHNGSPFNVLEEMLKAENYNRFINTVINCGNPDKIKYLTERLSGYVKQHNVSISNDFIETKEGKLYYAFLNTIYRVDTQIGYDVTVSILNEFNTSALSLLSMALFLEGIILDIPDTSDVTEKLWDNVFEKIAKDHILEISAVNNILLTNRRLNDVFKLYSANIASASAANTAYEIFSSNYRDVIVKDGEYAGQYAAQVMKQYYDKLKCFSPSESDQYLKSLLKLIIQNNLKTEFTLELIADISNNIPLNGKHDKVLVNEIYHYQKRYFPNRINNRILLIAAASEIESGIAFGSWRDIINKLDEIFFAGQVSLSVCDREEEKIYMEWLMPNVFSMCSSGCDFRRIFKYYEMSDDQKKSFILYFADSFIRQIKKSDDRIPYFCRYITIVLKAFNKPEITDEIIYMLNGLNKAKINGIDECMKKSLQEKELMDSWNEIKSKAESGNPVKSFMHNIIKKIKK